MKIINHTKLPNEYLKAIAKMLTKGVTKRIQTITFSYTRTTAWRGYCKFWFSMVINVAFAKDGSGFYPFHANQNRHVQFNFPQYDVNGEEEAAVVCLAHEIYHAKANIHHWKNTEKRAEAYAFKILQKMRAEI